MCPGAASVLLHPACLVAGATTPCGWASATGTFGTSARSPEVVGRRGPNTLRPVSPRPHPVRVLLVSFALVAAVSLGLAACGGDGGTATPGVEAVDPGIAADHDFLIPAGSGERIDAGEELDIFPAVLQARVGETIRIVNDDDRGHLVGPFYIAASSTLTQRFASAGRFIGTCSVHPSGDFVLEVSA